MPRHLLFYLYIHTSNTEISTLSLTTLFRSYPAGELKHGPLALVDDEMPVIVLAPHDELLEKLKSNLQEVRARGDRKSTRLNSSHTVISYAVFCLKKKKNIKYI